MTMTHEAYITENGEQLDLTHEEAFVLREWVYRCHDCGPGAYHLVPDAEMDTVEEMLLSLRRGA